LSDIRPLSFRKIASTEGGAGDSSGLRKPNWQHAGSLSVRPAPFARDEHAQPHAGSAEPAQHAQEELSPEPKFSDPRLTEPKLPAEAVARRSSYPPRRSVFPQVAISRIPPPPEVEEEPKVSEEQEAFAQAALDLGALRARILSGVENELLGLAVHIAQAIIEREVTLDATLHKTLARTAVLALGDTQAARLRVSRAAYRAISELYGQAAIDVDGVRVEVSMDNSLDALSVVAEAGPSRVDSRMSERLAAVLRAMEAEHRRSNADLASEEHQNA
jgi:hypothetical protein